MKNQILGAARALAKRALPADIAYALRARRSGVGALFSGLPGQSADATRVLMRQFQQVTDNVSCGHSEEEMLRLAIAILSTPGDVPGLVVECGCWKGGSTCKLSLAARAAGRTLRVYDSFEGIPENDEGMVRNIHGSVVTFRAGDYSGALEEVRGNVERFGAPEVVEYRKGWFSDTLPGLDEPVAVAYLDVDLVDSTMTCLEHLWPRLSPGGVIFSQDGHLLDVLNAMADPFWWRDRFGHGAPFVVGAGEDKLVYIGK